MPTPELQILKPINPAITDPDEYEIFVLSDAQVVYESNGKPANLLTAFADTPMRVQGRLEALGRGQMKYLVKKPYKPVDLVIRDVTRFSYGQMTDGELVIWALGKAGWFEVRPARNYKAIHQDMVEAVELLYFITDIYNEPRKRGGRPSAQLIYQEYAEDERNPCNDPGLAQSLFYKHHEFLVMCFLAKAQGISWGSTPLYQSLRKQFPKTFEAAKARLEGRIKLAEKPAEALKASPAPVTQKARTARTEKLQTTKPPNPSKAPKRDNNWWEAGALYEFIRSAINKGFLRPGRHHINIERVAQLMVKRYEIEDMETAKTVLLVHATNLCYKMEHPRSRSAKFLVDEPIYRELQAEHDLTAAETRRAETVELRPRKDYTLLNRVQSNESEEESSEEAFVTPQRRPDRRKKRGRLSVLRPISGKYSGKGKGVEGRAAKGKAPRLLDSSAEDADSSAEAELETDSDSSSDIEIDTPTHALSPSREKRKFAEADGDDVEDKGQRKRAASKSITSDSPISSDEEDDADVDTEAQLPLRYKRAKSTDEQSKPNLVMATASTPLAVYEANGPRDSWICTFDGCSQRLYGCSKDIGQQLITEHLEDHAKGRHAAVGILLREEEKLRLPVDNLLKRIRDLSEAKTPLFPPDPLDPASPALQPQPIRRVI